MAGQLEQQNGPEPVYGCARWEVGDVVLLDIGIDLVLRI